MTDLVGMHSTVLLNGWFCATSILAAAGSVSECWLPGEQGNPLSTVPSQVSRLKAHASLFRMRTTFGGLDYY